MELGAGEAIPRPQERHQTTGVEGAVSSIKETIRVSVGWWETIFSLSLHTDFPNLSIKILCENVQQTDMKIYQKHLNHAIWWCHVVVLLNF